MSCLDDIMGSDEDEDYGLEEDSQEEDFRTGATLIFNFTV